MAKRKRRSTNDTFLKGMGMGVLLAGFVLLKAKYGQPQKAEKKDAEPAQPVKQPEAKAAPMYLHDIIAHTTDAESAIKAIQQAILANQQVIHDRKQAKPNQVITESPAAPVDLQDVIESQEHFASAINALKEHGQLWQHGLNQWAYDKLTQVYTKIYNTEPLVDHEFYWANMSPIQKAHENLNEGGLNS